jgi:2-polyprenyl-6-hydroxyphenyl methylase/3-demethylubiquinone-9 3-methyltransferase
VEQLVTEDFDSEIDKGQRFGFGSNWARFLAEINDQKIARAQKSLLDMLECESLDGRRFLDIGSGSGLFSLCARRLGADVHSFDFDPDSVDCTRELRRRYFENDPRWQVQQGSVLDAKFTATIEKADIVYSWGVLHHTGHMWDALNVAAGFAKPGSLLYIAIYNTQIWSRVWLVLKKIYNKLPGFLRAPYLWILFGALELRAICFNALNFSLGRYFRTRRDYDPVRGMSRWRDFVDWIGGLPFETATPDEIFDFYRGHGFTLRRMRTCGGGLGCNEFVFIKRQVVSD